MDQQKMNFYREKAIEAIESVLNSCGDATLDEYEERWITWMEKSSWEEIEGTLDVISHPPYENFIAIHFTGSTGWTWDDEAAVCLGAWGRLYPLKWLEKIEQLLKNQRTIYIALSAIIEVAEVDALPVLEPLMENFHRRANDCFCGQPQSIEVGHGYRSQMRRIAENFTATRTFRQGRDT